MSLCVRPVSPEPAGLPQSHFPFLATTAILFTLLFAAAGSSGATAGACGHDQVVVQGNPAETEATCAALRDVLDLFDGLGFPIEPRVTITFRDFVSIELAPAERGGPPTRAFVSGLFDADRHVIEITSPMSAHGGGRDPWGLTWSPEIAGSILRHELAHMATAEALGARWPGVAQAWREYLAYAIQFELMEPHLRAQILARYPHASPFDDLLNVNMMLLFLDPDLFGVRVHLHSVANGGRDHLRRLLSNAGDLPAGEILWTP